jgi:hypothetical protein
LSGSRRCVLCRNYKYARTQNAKKNKAQDPNVFSCVHMNHSHLQLWLLYLFFVYQLSGKVSATFYTWARWELLRLFSVTFSDDIAIPIRNINDQIPRAIGDALAAQAAARSETRCERQLILFCIRHL